MQTLKGTISYALQGVGSKSEGKVAILTTADGTVYKLHRAEAFPLNDEFFAPFDAAQVEVQGESDGGNRFRVHSVITADGAQVEAAVASQQPVVDIGPIVLSKEPHPKVAAEAEDVPVGQVQLLAVGRRLPRRLKKKLKKLMSKQQK